MSQPQALIIEDEHDLALLFSEALQAAGYAVEIVLDGKQAGPKLLAVRPALVLLDLHLPEVSGMELIELIRAEPQLRAVRVIVASADEQRVKLLEDKADLTLVKPITFSQLRDLAARFFAEQQGQTTAV